MRAPKKEYDAVEAVVQKFVDAIHAGDSSIFKPYVVEQPLIAGNADGVFTPVTKEVLFSNIDACKEIGPQVDFRIDILALEETIAIVSLLEENMGPINYTNYFVLRKSEGEWKLLVHAYNQNSDTIK